MKFLFISLIFFSSLSFAGGVHVGNGGNVIQCSGKSHFQSLDYVLTVDFFGKKFGLVKVQSVAESFDRISKILAKKYPNLQPSFLEFVHNIKNTKSGSNYIWKGVYDVETAPREMVQIPYSCLNHYDSVEIQQAVLRRTPDLVNGVPGPIVFEYDIELLSDLEKTDPLQLSFLMVHEWLWNYTKSPSENRQLDYYLHSTLVEED
jgi:hypothetical protein